MTCSAHFVHAAASWCPVPSAQPRSETTIASDMARMQAVSPAKLTYIRIFSRAWRVSSGLGIANYNMFEVSYSMGVDKIETAFQVVGG